MKKHNGIISIWKFIFCLVIIIFHVSEYQTDDSGILFQHGAMGVEYFFIVSGYLMAKSAMKKDTESDDDIGKETFQYIWSKIKAFFPYVVYTFLLAIILSSIAGTMDVKKYILSIWDLLLLRYSGLKGAGLLHHLWYITAMLVTMAILYPQIKKFKKSYFYLVAPIVIFFLAGILNRIFGDLTSPNEWVGWIYRGMPRAYLEMSIGSVLFPLSLKLKEIKFTNLSRILLTILEILGFVGALFICNQNSGNYDFILLLLLSVSISLVFSEKTLEYDICNNKLFYHLEKMSLVLYFIHLPIRNFLREYVKQGVISMSYWNQLIIVLVTSFVIGYLVYGLVTYLKKKNYFSNKIKAYFIEESVPVNEGRENA